MQTQPNFKGNQRQSGADLVKKSSGIHNNTTHLFLHDLFLANHAWCRQPQTVTQRQSFNCLTKVPILCSSRVVLNASVNSVIYSIYLT